MPRSRSTASTSCGTWADTCLLRSSWRSNRALVPVLATWRGWRRVVNLSHQDFRWAFAHTMSAAEQRSAYDAQITPESGRIFFQAALAGFDRHSPAKVNFGNGLRAPLLLIGGAKDRIVPAAVSQRNFRAYAGSRALTAYLEYPGRTHWTIAEPGWQEVATDIAGWLAARASAEP